MDRDDSTIAGQGGTGGEAPAAASEILNSVGTATYEWAVPSDRLTWSENAGALLGIDARHLATGRGYAQMLAKESPAGRYEAIVNSPHIDRGDGVAYAIEYAICGKEGVTHWVEDSGRWFASSDGRPLRAHGAVRIITESYETRRRLIEASEIDPMTGQLSRHRFCEVLESALEDAVKVRGSIGLLVAAVDNLAHVNEAYGFDIADEIIAAVGKRIRTRLRGGDLLGRLSGNKFGMLIRNCQPEDMEIAAERILNAVRDDVFLTRAGPVAITVTIGGIIAPRHADSLAAMLGRAQEALDGIKARRRGAFKIYAPSLERERARQENLKTTDEIVSALNDRRIGLAFQPIVTAGPERRAAYYECLLRIRRADGTLLPASAIVPLAEKLGLVRLVDARVLELTMAELIAAPGLRLSVNVSPATTMDMSWLRALEAYQRSHPDAVERLMVEITETSAIADVEDTRRFVARVQALGCRVAIDDFGAGHTSFRNLRKLGINCVKIDGAFVASFHSNPDDRHFVKALLELARHMNLTTIAEWVPSEEVAVMLADLGCNYLQGDHTGPASDARPWLAAGTAPRALSA